LRAPAAQRPHAAVLPLPRARTLDTLHANVHIRARNGHLAKNIAEFGHFERKCAMWLDALHANVHIRARNVRIRAERSAPVAHSRSKRPDSRFRDASRLSEPQMTLDSKAQMLAAILADEYKT